MFAFGQTYELLFLARSVQGISSACIGVSGMSLVASQYPEEDKRSRIMGFVLGSIALGVLVGYPIGSVLYDLEGKMAPFLLVSCFIVLTICTNLSLILRFLPGFHRYGRQVLCNTFEFVFNPFLCRLARRDQDTKRAEKWCSKTVI